MTEDYEVGLRIGALGLKTMFVRIPAQPGERGVVASRGHFLGGFQRDRGVRADPGARKAKPIGPGLATAKRIGISGRPEAFVSFYVGKKVRAGHAALLMRYAVL